MNYRSECDYLIHETNVGLGLFVHSDHILLFVRLL